MSRFLTAVAEVSTPRSLRATREAWVWFVVRRRRGAVIDTPGDWLEEQMAREQLHIAAQDGDLARVRELIASGHPVNAFDDDLALTPLPYAARKGHLEVMKALIEAGADVNAHDEQRIGNTPLREVAGNCSCEVAKLLVDAGADPLLPGWMRITALDESAQRKKPEGMRVNELLQAAADKRRPH